MFLFKKIVAPFFFPLSLCLEILLFGLFLLWFTSREKFGRVVITFGVILLTLLSCNYIPTTLIRSLEYKYEPLREAKDLQDTKWVVVLGGGHISDSQLPSLSQLSKSSLARLMEGIRIHRMLHGSRIVLSGGSAFDPVPNAIVMSKVALAMGVDKQDLLLETLSRDTKDEARLIREIVGNERFILVTSAFHMPRSMALFRKLGMEPIPAPTDYWTKESQRINPGMFFPTADGLRKAERAFHEYLGLAWSKIRREI